jgi:hypothetical protein
MRRLAIRNPPIAKHHIDYSEFEHNKNSPNLFEDRWSDGVTSSVGKAMFLKRGFTQDNVPQLSRQAKRLQAYWKIGATAMPAMPMLE